MSLPQHEFEPEGLTTVHPGAGSIKLFADSLAVHDLKIRDAISATGEGAPRSVIEISRSCETTKLDAQKEKIIHCGLERRNHLV